MLKKKSKALHLGQFFALVASLLIAAQIGYSQYLGTPFCLNDGCKVVEKLTRVSPLVFNLVGLCFFQVIFWGLRLARNEPRRLPQWVKALLLAGLAAEGVLISFQYLVAQAFCAYCLIILAFIVMLNLLIGLRQAMPGLLLFVVVSLAFASLDIRPPQSSQQAFTAGIFASRTGAEKLPENFLFFSSTCAHCEKVIAALRTNNRATVHFNPIDQVKDLDLAGISRTGTYSPTTNKALLGALGIDEIPVLMTKTPEGLSIRRGEAAILAYLGQTTLADTARQTGTSPLPASPAAIPGLDSGDGCSVATDCADAPGGTSRQPGR